MVLISASGGLEAYLTELVLISASGGLEAYLNRDGFNISIWRTRRISKHLNRYGFNISIWRTRSIRTIRKAYLNKNKNTKNSFYA